MKRYKTGLQKAFFLITQFLVEFNYYLFLFATPFYIYLRIKTPILIGAALIMIGFGKLVAALLLNKAFRKCSLKFIYLLAFAIQLLIVCLLNKTFAPISVIFAAFCWSFTYCLLKFAGQLDVKFVAKDISKGWEFVQRPVKASALILAPLLGAFIALNFEVADYISYLGILVALTAGLSLIFLGHLNQSTQIKDYDQETLVLSGIVKKLNKTTIITGYILGYFWVFAPLKMYLLASQSSAVYWIILWLNLPYLLILIWKNIFCLHVWQLRPIAKYLLLTVSLGLFFFNLTGVYLLLAVVFLGVVLGLIQSSDAQERSYSQHYKLHQISFGLGFIMAMFLGTACLNIGKLNWGIGVLSSAVFFYLLIKLLKEQLSAKR